MSCENDPDLLWLCRELAERRRYGRLLAPAPVGTIVVLGGGTAGYLSALILRQTLPRAKITVVESPSKPIIGVGEATVPSILPFLHRRLRIDVAEFHRLVQPTWKQGIRFEWGKPAPYHFNAPFDWDQDTIGVAGSVAHTGTINDMTFQSMLMELGGVPIFRRSNGEYTSLLDRIQVAYHLDNRRFVEYLRRLVDERKIERLQATVRDVLLNQDGRSGIHSIVAEPDVRLTADLFIDCSGFHARLVEQALDVRFERFDSSLFTNRALVFNVDHHGDIKPYTTATTMSAGWLWTIPQVDQNHCGYVFSDECLDGDSAAAEVEQKLGVRLSDAREVLFRSGRASRAWVGNTIAIGNCQGFVEPLESSGLLMITTALEMMVDALAGYPETPSVVDRFNNRIAGLWDGLRWFLAMHYKFNRCLDTPFWQYARNATDISGIEDTLALFKTGSPLRFRHHALTWDSPHFYGVAGIDAILLGQGVETRMVADLDATAWTRRRDRAAKIARSAVTMGEALRIEELTNFLPVWQGDDRRAGAHE